MKKLVPIIIIIFFLIIVIFFIKIVKNNSMSPILKNNDIVFVSPFFLIKKNTIYGFKHNKKIYVKRLIAIPDDIVEINKNILFINYIEYGKIAGNISPIILGKEQYFFLGDNFLDSLDSRNFGFISKKDIKFRILFIIYPFNRIGFVK